MKKLLSILWVALIATTAWASRSFDGTEAIYFNADAVNWWTNGNAVQRAVLDNTTPVIGTVVEGKIYAFTIPAGTYSTIRFERAETAESGAWNKTGDITIDAEKNYVKVFAENSATVTWDTYVAPQEGEDVSIYFINYPQWAAPRVHLWGGTAAATTWPGAAMTKLDDQINGCDVYQFTSSLGEYANCIFSDNGANQTATLTWTSGKYYYNNAWYDRENIPQTINTYHLYVKNETDWATFDLYAYGTPSEPFGAWPGKTNPETVVIDEISYLDYPFTVAEGGTVNLTLLFHNNVGEGQEGDRRIEQSITEAKDHYLTVTDDVPAIETAIKVLSINNSLIDYNDQYAMFNAMSAAMGKDASWTKHTNLGKTLAYHYNEDPLTPNAKEVVAGVAWTHIILQEQSSLPRTNLQAFYDNVQTWVTYIRANCPNQEAEIILPINWAYSGDPDFQTNNAEMIDNYKAVADDFNISLCPVGIAYGNYQLDYPSAYAADLYSDDRHPTATATYLACCLEYATIFGEDPSTITWKPDGISADMAARMRTYAQEAYEGTQRMEPAPQPATAALVITDAIAHTENFNSLGTQDPSLSPVEAGKTAVAQACTLPQGWRIENNTTAARTIGSFANASETTTYIGGVSIVSNDKNGTWNFGASNDAADRAAGGITSSAGARTITLMVHLLNDANENFNTLTLSYDVEKYRNGANAAGFTVQLYTSADGVNWASAGSDFATVFDADGNTDGADIVPITTRNVTGSLECVFPQEGELYLAWSISATTGTDLAKSMALAIDNVSITPSISTDIPTDAVILTSSATVTENFNSLGGAEVDAAARGTDQASTLPTGWKIERNTSTSEPRKLNAYAAASDTTMYIGGQSLASNAYNGTWNFGATGSSDRAVGGLTTGVENGTRGINIMTRLYNNSGTEFKAIDLSYDIEKYRNGSNAAGFTVQLYTSADGATWTDAGDNFKTSFTPDANNNGFASVPASTTQVSKTLNVVFPAYTSLYLAWNISVSSGTTCNAAPGLALDNVSITPKTSIPSNMEDIQNDRVQSTKLLRNGVLLIEKNGRIYNILGTEVK